MSTMQPSASRGAAESPETPFDPSHLRIIARCFAALGAVLFILAVSALILTLGVSVNAWNTAQLSLLCFLNFLVGEGSAAIVDAVVRTGQMRKKEYGNRPH